MTSNSSRPSSKHLLDDQCNEMEHINSISSASGFEPNSLVLRGPNAVRLNALESRLYACESRLRALEYVSSGSSGTPFSTLGTNSNLDFNLSQESDALANTLVCDTILGADAAISELNYNYASEGLASAVEAEVNAHIIGARHDDEQMDDIDFGNFLNIDLDHGVQPNILSSANSQGIQAANSILDNAATFTPAARMSLQGASLPLASAVNAVGPVAPRVRCTVCGKTFGRATDRRRHELKHNQNATRYPCPRADCRYSGANGMLRKDKLREHQARHNHY